MNSIMDCMARLAPKPLAIRTIGITPETIPQIRLIAYTLLDANIGYDWKDWEFNVFGLNLTDEEYYTSLVTMRNLVMLTLRVLQVLLA